MEITDKYINPFTDFGFKKLFGTEPNKDLLIDFLNQLLKGERQISALSTKTRMRLAQARRIERPFLIFIALMKKASGLSLSFRRPVKPFLRTGAYTTPPFPSGSRPKKESGTLN